MDRRRQLMQQWQDGRLGAAEAQAVACMVANDPVLAAEVQQSDAIDAALKIHVLDRQVMQPQVFAERIMDALPNRPPATMVRVRLVDILVAFVVCTLATGTYALAGMTLRHQAAVVWIALISVILGGLLLTLPQLVRSVEAGLWTRIMRRPVMVSQGDVLVMRCLGLVVAGGGAWLMLSA